MLITDNGEVVYTDMAAFWDLFLVLLILQSFTKFGFQLQN
jgi:hypothetical protein